MAAWVSSRNKIPMIRLTNTVAALNKFGKRYGKRSQMVPLANRSG
jgi:hypothetical protein